MARGVGRAVMRVPRAGVQFASDELISRKPTSTHASNLDRAFQRQRSGSGQSEEGRTGKRSLNRTGAHFRERSRRRLAACEVTRTKSVRRRASICPRKVTRLEGSLRDIATKLFRRERELLSLCAEPEFSPEVGPKMSRGLTDDEWHP